MQQVTVSEREALCFTARGPGPLKGPGQVLLLDAQCGAIFGRTGTMNETEHKSFKWLGSISGVVHKTRMLGGKSVKDLCECEAFTAWVLDRLRARKNFAF